MGDLHASVLCSFVVSSQFFVSFAVTGRSSWLLCSAVCLLSPSFLDRPIRLVAARVTFALQFWCIFSFLQCSLWLVGSGVTFALLRCCISQFFALITVICSSTCHPCSTAISGRERVTVACCAPLRSFRGLLSLLLGCGICHSPR